MKPYRIFTGARPYEALDDARDFLRARGFSFGARARNEPIGVALGEIAIGRLSHLYGEEIADLDGRLEALDFVKGPVRLYIRPDAPAAVFEALARPGIGEDKSEPPAIAPDPDAELNAVIATLPPMHKASLLTIARQLAECGEPITGIHLVRPAAPARSAPKADTSSPAGSGAGAPPVKPGDDVDHDARHAVEGKPEGLTVGAIN